MARFNILKGPNGKLLHEAVARREEHFKVHFTLQPAIATTLLGSFRVYVCVDKAAYKHIDYVREVRLIPVGNLVKNHLVLNGQYSLVGDGGHLSTEIIPDRFLPLDWLGLDNSVLRPLKEHGTRIVDDLTWLDDTQVWDIYVRDTLHAGIPMSSTIATDAASLVEILRHRLQLMGIETPFWTHTKAELAAL